jgi:hypothetical protein
LRIADLPPQWRCSSIPNPKSAIRYPRFEIHTLIILSGGQTGVDRGALEAALETGTPCGGWCPAGRRSEDGAIDSRFPLKETHSHGYEQRTEWNVRDADATLIVTRGSARPGSGTEFTLRLAGRYRRPVFLANIAQVIRADTVGAKRSEIDLAAIAAAWARGRNIATLNVAGPRESQSPGIQKETKEWLVKLLKMIVRR